MRFLADMGVDIRAVAWLRSQGHDAVHLREQGLHRLPDTEIFEKAYREHRIILTFDFDFAEIAAFAQTKLVSVIVFRLHNTRTHHVIGRLARILEASGSVLSEGVVITVEESRHRLRSLPIRTL